MRTDHIIYWVRSTGPEGKDRVPMYFKRRLARDTDEGSAGDVQARPVALGSGGYTATYAWEDFEYADGSRAFTSRAGGDADA